MTTSTEIAVSTRQAARDYVPSAALSALRDVDASAEHVSDCYSHLPWRLKYPRSGDGWWSHLVFHCLSSSPHTLTLMATLTARGQLPENVHRTKGNKNEISTVKCFELCRSGNKLCAFVA